MQGWRHDWRIRSATVGLIAGLAIFGRGSIATAQRVVERQTRETGPRGRTIERDVRIERSPGMVERDITIKRPSGTFTRDTVIQNMPGGGWFGGGTAVESRPGARPTIVENELIVNNPPPVWGGPGYVNGWGWGFGGAGLGLGLPGFGMFLGASAPAPTIIVEPVPPPLIIAPGPPRPVIVAGPPAQYDPVFDALERLKSLHEHIRRDGALSLGNLKAARAVPALVDRLKNDWSKDVRVASAWALGEIRDPRAGVALQRASLFDHRTEVRAVASKASEKLREAQPLRAGGGPQNATVNVNSSWRKPSNDAPPIVSTEKSKASRTTNPHVSLLDSDPPPPPPTPYAPEVTPSAGSPKN